MYRGTASWVRAISIGCFAAILTLDSSRLLAASDCLEEPNRASAQGGHWYYRLDRATGRKCWHMEAAPAAIPPQAEPAPPPSPPPQPDTARLPFSSFFSSLGSPFTTASTPQPDPANRDARGPIAQPAPLPRVEDGAPKRRRPADAKPAPEPKQKASLSLDQADRDALFREYLRWREKQ
jgi:hypothetical protein